MQPLADTSNLERPEAGGSKRQRLGQLQQPATFQLVVDRAGIRGLLEASDDCLQQPAPSVDDPRQAKRQLAADLASATAQETFLSGLAEALADESLLHRCLLPITVTVQVSYATGDSLIRLLLNMLPLQQQVATLLLHKLPEFSQADCDGGGAGGGQAASSVPNLILGQLRWLEVAADAEALTRTVLEVLPVCSPPVQQQLIGFLPECVQQQDHELVVGQLQGLLEQDLTFMAAVLDCVSNMQLQQHLQDQLMTSLLDQLPAVEVEDLPGLVRYLLLTAGKSNAEQVLAAVRASLQFVSAADPRLAVADRKQKGPAAHASRSPEVLLVKDLVAALQMNEAAAAAALALEGSLTELSAHRCFDLLVLLALHAKGGSSRKSVEALLRRKLLEGQATAAWIRKSLQGHQASFRELWPPLLSLAELWSRAREAPLSAAAAQLYCDLFVVFESSLERQQVLQALHSHLGSGVAAEQDVALQALSELARAQSGLLGQYSSYLANVLDHLEGFTDAQLHQVFAMFAALTAMQPGQQQAGQASSSGAAAAAGGGGSRLEDELAITLNKALAQASPAYKRIGVIGSLALLQQAAADYGLVSNTADDSAASSLFDSWVSRADSVFSQSTAHPGVLAFMMEKWAELLEQPAAGGGQGFATPVPKPMLDWLLEKVQELLNMFIADMSPGATQSEDQEQPRPPPEIACDDASLQPQLWFNCDGALSPLYMRILPLACSRDASKRAVLVCLPSALQLLAAVSRQGCGGTLTGIDALLGCPLALPDTALFTDRWDGLPLPSKVCVLTSLLHAISWLREVVAVFAPSFSTDALLAAGSTQTTLETIAELQNKLLMRLSQLRMLEALFVQLAGSCPAAAQQLPDLSRPLSSSGLCAAGAAAAVAAKLRASAGAAAGAAGGGKDKEPQAMTGAEALARARCCRVPGLTALNCCQPPNMLLTALLPCAHVAADLHTKLKLLLNRARKPAGLMGPPAPVATSFAAAVAGVGGAGAAAAGGTAKSPPCLQNVTLQQLVEQLLPTLPALQQHLATALGVIREPPESGDWLFKDLPGSQDAALLALCGFPAVQPVVDAAAAAHSLAMASIQTFAMLLGATKELTLLQIAKTLAALAGQPGAAGTDQQQLHGLLIAAFKACKKLSCRASGSSNLQLELAALSLWQAIAALSASQQLPAQKQAAMANVLSRAAEGLLQESWQLPDEAEEAGKGFSWKGQAAAVTQLLTVLIARAPDPSQKLLSLVTEVLNEVPAKVPTKQQLDPIAGFAALCSATFLTWYKVLFEQLVAHWEKLMQQGLALLTPATAAAASQATRGGRGRKAQQPQLNSQGQPDWDEAKVDEVVAAASRCAAAFGPLVALAKVHQTRNGLLGQAVKLGAAFVDGLLKAMPLWQALFHNGRDAQFLALIKDVQKGTKVMQTICNEGKARRAGALLSRAPAAKRSLERFLFEMMAFFNAAGAAEAFRVGTLKHRDLDGNVVGSQICPDEDEDEDDEEEEEDDAQDGGDDD